MSRPLTYGKRSAPRVLPAIFSSPSAPSSQQVLEVDLSKLSLPTSSRPPLDDVTEILSKFSLESSQEVPSNATYTVPEKEPASNYHSPVRTRAGLLSSSKLEEWLLPLQIAFDKLNRPELVVQSWQEFLDESWTVVKIAESSFAEVYKVSNDEGSSIVKLIALRPPDGPGSKRQTSAIVQDVISELLIMDLMADTPRFVEFKDAHLIRGRAPTALVRAYEKHNLAEKSEFPKPSSYHKVQYFLALELGNAGMDIEHFEIKTFEQMWDIFLSVTLALATGENFASFEHRDLHEGNVCVKEVRPSKKSNRNDCHRFGYSGLEITILDYTLSRLEHQGSVIFLDLDKDVALFQQEGHLLQNQMYERMRNWVFFRNNKAGYDELSSPQPFKSLQVHSPWEDYNPYTNVIWLYYIYDYVQKTFTGPAEDLIQFCSETAELRECLHPDVTLEDGGFSDANDLLEYAFEMGWIEDDDELSAL